MNENAWFKQQFGNLTHYSPYPWQMNLFNRFIEGIIPKNITLPTGVGKTNAISIWLLARVKNPTLPRRLVYVVDRRSVVDQATKVVEQMVANLPPEIKDALAGSTLPDEALLGVSSLRGEFEDNEEWSKMPFRPSVLVGTVDKVGSALMFSSYGDGPYRRPVVAGLLGNDTMIVFDECHLVPAFETLLRNIEEVGGKLKQFHAMTMSATSSGDDLALSNEDSRNETLGKRLNAKKKLEILNTSQVLVKHIARLSRENPPRRTIVFVNSPRTAVEITESLKAGFKNVISLTGTIRGKERDDLVDNPVFQAFMIPQSPAEPHFLVATSAGEVGIDLTCDRMITDMTRAASFVQRAGRVNRFGESENAKIFVVFKQSEVEKFGQQADLQFIRDLNGDASCAAIYAKREELAAITRKISVIPSLEPAVLDVLGMTSLDHSVNIAEYLRGKEASNRYVEVAWRAEVPLLAQMSEHDFEAYMKRMRVLGFEKLNETEKRVLEVLEAHPTAEVIVVDATGKRHVTTISAIVKGDLTDGLLLLPPSAGGLASGMLSSSNVDKADLDIACIKHKYHEARIRILCAADAVPALGKNEKELFYKEVNGQALIVRKVKDRKRTVRVLLSDHLEEARVIARTFAEKAGLDVELVAALEVAGKMHDVGKANPIWQVAARGSAKGKAIAKGGMRFNPNALNGYRHEFEGMAQTENELAKHLVGSHHAGARPSWIGERALAPINRDEDAVVTQVNRFAALQMRFGWWGLAYLDAMMKCADAYISEE